MVAPSASDIPTPRKAQNLLGNALRLVPELQPIAERPLSLKPVDAPTDRVGGIGFEDVRGKMVDITTRALQGFAAATHRRASAEAPGKVDAEVSAAARRSQAYWSGIHNASLAILLEKTDARLRVLQSLVAAGLVRRTDADTDDSFLERLLDTYEKLGRPATTAALAERAAGVL